MKLVESETRAHSWKRVFWVCSADFGRCTGPGDELWASEEQRDEGSLDKPARYKKERSLDVRSKCPARRQIPMVFV